MKIFQLIDLIIRLFKLNKRSKVVLLFLVPTFLLAQNQAFWLGKRPSAGAPTNLLLDDYPGAAAAYSVRKLDKDYTGFAMEIRRASDNATQDIGFVGENLDVTSINTFCSGTTCTVRTWYDQSGNGRNAVQATAINQPTIYTGGSVITDNLKPSLLFNGTSNLIKTSATFQFNDVTAILIASQLSTETNSYGRFLDIENVNGLFVGRAVLNNQIVFGSKYPASPYGSVISASNNTQYVIFGYRISSSGQIYASLNELSEILSTGSTGITANGVLSIGARQDNVSHGNKKIQEIIIYSSNQKPNKTGFLTNINTYYSIY